ncbi:MAG: VCBS repeat-containing protein [Planctomycetes bacterium]|nr:VCBS repeat-containing protein [Planctomycetota bacterium]
MNKHLHGLLPLAAAVLLICAPGNPALGQWVQFNNETATRLNASAANGASDVEEKDYAWGDVDQDGDIDLVSVRKQPFTSAGKRTNVLYLNEGGVLTDRTTLYATDTDVPGDQGFNTPTNDRDVLLVDLNQDGWLDIVTAVTISDGDTKAVGHPRIYRNKGSIAGVWQGFKYEVNRIPTMLSLTGGSFNPRFCSVAAGDLNGDGAPELWFGDYDSSGSGGVSEPAGADFDDRLLMNDGNGFFTDVTNGAGTHFAGTITVGASTYPFQKSAFGAAAAIEDMNGDGLKDIVKQTALNPPQYIGIGYNKASNPGYFDTYRSVYTTAPYFVSVGDLNNDNRLDMVVSDDGTDRYLLNTGNNAQGLASFSTILFPTATNGFGGQSVIADLNNDGWKDVLISDVDVDIGPCGGRVADILRNNGNAPNVTFTSDTGNIAASTFLAGVHNFAVFDINGDGWLDLVVGRCSTTQVWINVPPTGLAFTYPLGLPSLVSPNATTTIRVQVTEIGAAVLDEPTGIIWTRVNGGAWSSAPMVLLGSPGLYEATLPAMACASTVDFYVAASAVGGATSTGPPGAPASFNSAIASVGTDDTIQDFEAGDGGWTVVNDPSVTAGAWVRVDPVGALNGTAQSAPEDDAQAGTDKVFCFVTGNGVVGGGSGAADVDGGPTHLISPPIDLAGTDATISFSAWAYSSATDVLTVAVSNDNGANWTQVETILSTASSWQSFSFRVGEFFPGQPLTSAVRVRFSASDNPNNSITEAGIDVFQVSKILCLLPCACAADLNTDTKRDGADIAGFVACMVGGGTNCQCGDLDSTGSIDFIDVTAFVDSILEGNNCPP